MASFNLSYEGDDIEWNISVRHPVSERAYEYMTRMFISISATLGTSPTIETGLDLDPHDDTSLKGPMIGPPHDGYRKHRCTNSADCGYHHG